MLLVMDFLGTIVHVLILKTIANTKPTFFIDYWLRKVKKTFSWGFQIYLVLFHICEFMSRPWLTVVKFCQGFLFCQTEMLIQGAHLREHLLKIDYTIFWKLITYKIFWNWLHNLLINDYMIFKKNDYLYI